RALALARVARPCGRDALFQPYLDDVPAKRGVVREAYQPRADRAVAVALSHREPAMRPDAVADIGQRNRVAFEIGPVLEPRLENRKRRKSVLGAARDFFRR